MARAWLLFFQILVMGYLAWSPAVVDALGKPLKKDGRVLYDGSYAVVIGVSQYDYYSDLPNASSDAVEVGEILEELGFEVLRVIDPTRDQLNKVLTSIEFNYKEDQVKNHRFVLFFAGHGETETLSNGEKRGYIVPRDAPLQSDDPAGFLDKAISMRQIDRFAKGMHFKHALFVFDSCFSGTVIPLQRERGMRAKDDIVDEQRRIPQYIVESCSKKVRQFITSGSEDETVPDRSTFKVVLLDALKGEGDFNEDRFVTGEELSCYITQEVVNYTSGFHHPQYTKMVDPVYDKGDFVFQRLPLGWEPEKASEWRKMRPKELAFADRLKCKIGSTVETSRIDISKDGVPTPYYLDTDLAGYQAEIDLPFWKILDLKLKYRHLWDRYYKAEEGQVKGVLPFASPDERRGAFYIEKDFSAEIHLPSSTPVRVVGGYSERKTAFSIPEAGRETILIPWELEERTRTERVSAKLGIYCDLINPPHRVVESGYMVPNYPRIPVELYVKGLYKSRSGLTSSQGSAADGNTGGIRLEFMANRYCSLSLSYERPILGQKDIEYEIRGFRLQLGPLEVQGFEDEETREEMGLRETAKNRRMGLTIDPISGWRFIHSVL